MCKPQIPVFTLLVLTVAMVNSDRRIILVGNDGSGKSKAGNIILGKEVFQNHFQETNTDLCRSEESVGDNGEHVSIVYTPGLGEFMKKDTINCVAFHSFPGPHAFLLVVNVKARSTSEENAAVKWMKDNFGQDASMYTILLFTHTDRLKGKSLEEYIRESEHLRRLKDLCEGRYHTFNEQLEDRSQVSELMKKIEKMVRENGGKHYTNDLYEETRRKMKKHLDFFRGLAPPSNKERASEEDKKKCKEFLKSKLHYIFDFIYWLLSWFFPQFILQTVVNVYEFNQNCNIKCLFEILEEMLYKFFS